MEFLQSATQELWWLSEKETAEVTRDWSSSRLNVPSVEEFYKVTMVTHYHSYNIQPQVLTS